jgi:hypothetical protein
MPPTNAAPGARFRYATAPGLAVGPGWFACPGRGNRGDSGRITKARRYPVTKAQTAPKAGKLPGGGPCCAPRSWEVNPERNGPQYPGSASSTHRTRRVGSLIIVGCPTRGPGGGRAEWDTAVRLPNISKNATSPPLRNIPGSRTAPGLVLDRGRFPGSSGRGNRARTTQR